MIKRNIKRPTKKDSRKSNVKMEIITTKKKLLQEDAKKNSKKKKKNGFMFFKKKAFRGKGNNKRCFIYRKKGHFSKSCPNKREKAAKLINSFMLATNKDVEFLYDEKESPNETITFGLLDSKESLSTKSESEHFPVLKIQETNFEHPESPPLPNVEMFILPSKYHVPIRVIAFIDTSSQHTMLNPVILPTEIWTSTVHKLKAS